MGRGTFGNGYTRALGSRPRPSQDELFANHIKEEEFLRVQKENEALRQRNSSLVAEVRKKDGMIDALTAERDKALEERRILSRECTAIALHLTKKKAGIVRELKGKHREGLREKDAEIAALKVTCEEAMAKIACLELEVADWKEDHMVAMMDVFALIELHLDGHKNSQKRFDRLKRSLYRVLDLDAAEDIDYNADHAKNFGLLRPSVSTEPDTNGNSSEESSVVAGSESSRARDGGSDSDSVQVQFKPGNSLSGSTTDNTPAPSTSPAISRTPLFLPGSSPTPEYPDPDDEQDSNQDARSSSKRKLEFDTGATEDERESTPEERGSKRQKLSEPVVISRSHQTLQVSGTSKSPGCRS